MLSFLPAAVPVALVVLVVVLWLQRAPRRAAIATLRTATASTRALGATAPAAGGPSVPARTLRPPRAGGEPASPVQEAIDIAAAPLAGMARRLLPPTYVESAGRRLTLAGKGRERDADRFLALRLVTVILVLPAFLVIWLAPFPGLYRLLGFVLVGALLSLGPEASLNRAVGERQERARRDLPAMVELLLISVEAGLGFDQAMSRAVTAVGGPLGEEFSRFLGEVRMGAGHAEALEAIDRRTGVDELRSFLMALVQAETFGVFVGTILRSQAEEVRTSQRQHVQELAQKAPVKMLFPLVFCVLPALFIVVIGPAAIEIYHTIIK